MASNTPWRSRPATRLPVLAKLMIASSQHPLEREADQVATWVTGGRHPSQAFPVEQGDEAGATPPKSADRVDSAWRTSTARTAASASPPMSDAAATRIRSMRGSGQRLAGETRGFFESRLGWDLQSVRIHAGPQASETAEELGARAFTIGDDIVFGADQYRPDSAAGRHLLAHELTHVLQQRTSPGQSLVQRKCKAPTPPFDLGTSDIGTAIKAGIAKVSTYDPATDTRVPKVDPATVLRALASSNCFLRDAAALASKFTMAGAKPTLLFNYHENPAIGHGFTRGAGTDPSVISVQVVDPVTVIEKTVHEVVHATHPPVRVKGETGEFGAVTQVERAEIGEERKTRAREREILEEIAAAHPDLGVRPSVEKPTDESVRGSFASGLPRLTYQERAIIAEMKRRAGKGGAAGAQNVALLWVRTKEVPAPTTATVGRFSISDATIKAHRARATSTLPPEAPSVDEARTCVRWVRSNPTWKAGLRGTFRGAPGVSRLPKDAREKLGPKCTAFIERYWERIERYEPTTREGLRDFYWDLTSRTKEVRHLREKGRAESRIFVRWLDSAIKGGASEAEALDYLEWHLIEEAFSAEWFASGSRTPTDDIRRRHLDFLTARLGKKKGLLRGISRPR